MHAGKLSTLQKARLFTGGLPDYIRIDDELHEPQDLQHAMRLARAYERRNASLFPWPAHHATGGQAALPTTLTSATSALTPSSAPSTPHTFKRLSPEEMAERRKMGLCYNCDEPC